MNNKEVQNNIIASMITYTNLKDIFSKLENYKYAIIKGEPLSYYAYGAFSQRVVRDIDFLTLKTNAPKIEAIIKEGNEVLNKSTRTQDIYYNTFSHQINSILLNKNGFKIEIDINFDILWGNYEGEQISIDEFLSNTVEMNIYGCKIKTLPLPKMFVSVCLHNYKDLNFIFLLWKRQKMNKNSFKDIYYLIKNNRNELSVDEVYNISTRYNVVPYIYYMLYYTYVLFKDDILCPYLDALKTPDGELIIDCYGLTTAERKKWNVDFEQRINSNNVFEYMKNDLTQKDLDNIKFNNKFF